MELTRDVVLFCYSMSSGVLRGPDRFLAVAFLVLF